MPVVARASTVEFINAGHLLGSAYARVTGRRQDDSVRRRPRPLRPAGAARSDRRSTEADILLLESTYGDRLHEPDDDGARLAAIVNDAVQRGGKLIIPSFAIGRVEEVLYWLKRLEDEKRIPMLPVYVDSPMAIGALQFYRSALERARRRAHELASDPASRRTVAARLRVLHRRE